MQRHDQDLLPVQVIERLPAGGLRPRPRGAGLCQAAVAVGGVPQRHQVAARAEGLVAGGGDGEGGELVAALEAGEVAGVVAGQAAQPRQREPALVPQSAQRRAPAVGRDLPGVSTRRARAIRLSRLLCPQFAGNPLAPAGSRVG